MFPETPLFPETPPVCSIILGCLFSKRRNRRNAIAKTLMTNNLCISILFLRPAFLPVLDPSRGSGPRKRCFWKHPEVFLETPWVLLETPWSVSGNTLGCCWKHPGCCWKHLVACGVQVKCVLPAKFWKNQIFVCKARKWPSLVSFKARLEKFRAFRGKV